MRSPLATIPADTEENVPATPDRYRNLTTTANLQYKEALNLSAASLRRMQQPAFSS